MGELLASFQRNFGTIAAVLLVLVFISVLPICARRRRWPKLGHLVVMLLSTAGAASGFKVSLLTMCLPAAQLGSLADDKPALMIGGIATLMMSLQGAVTFWRKISST
jgi:hypothetical protein